MKVRNSKLSPLQEAEKACTLRVLEENGWNMGKSARFLQICVVSLWRKCKKYGITKPRKEAA